MAINYVNYLTPNVFTNSTTVYNPTATGIQSTIIGMLLCNTSNSLINATVTMTSGSNTTMILSNVAIPYGSTFSAVDANRIIVAQNNSINVVATGTVDVTLSVIEVT
jgi:hypothetical protein